MNKRLIVGLIVCIILFMEVVSFGSSDHLSRVSLSPKTNKALVVNGIFNGGRTPIVFLKTLADLLSLNYLRYFVALETLTSFAKDDEINRDEYTYTGNVIYFAPYHGILLVYIDKNILKEAIDSFYFNIIHFRCSVQYEWDGKYVYFDLDRFFPHLLK